MFDEIHRTIQTHTPPVRGGFNHACGCGFICGGQFPTWDDTFDAYQRHLAIKIADALSPPNSSTVEEAVIGLTEIWMEPV